MVSSVRTVSGTMEGDALPNSPPLMGMQNYGHGTGSSATGSISDLGDSSTNLCNSHQNGERPQSNTDICSTPRMAEDTDLSSPRARFNTGTITTENGDNSSIDYGLHGIEEDAFEERLMLSQRTATQGHEGSGFFLRLGCLRKYAYNISCKSSCK